MPIKKKQLTFNEKRVISTDIKTPNPPTDDTGNKLKLGLGAPKVTRRNNLQNIHRRKKIKETLHRQFLMQLQRVLYS